MVGDSLTLDIAGGAGAGLRTVWVAQPGPGGEQAAPAPDFTVASVAQAVGVLLRSE